MKLLFVEDDAGLLMDFAEFAAKEGYISDTAQGLFSAMEKINLYDYDCIVLDINLPDGSGFEILEMLCKESKSDGVIILSARDSIDDKIKGLGLGADDYLTKPFYFSELMQG
jgi:DNA-binding response OmpR family regulator